MSFNVLSYNSGGDKNGRERKLQWVNWQITCRPKMQGGLNFKDLKAFNLAMLAKQGWRLLTRTNSLIYKVYRSKYFRFTNFLRADIGNNPSWGWRSVLEGRKVLEKGLFWRVGRGHSINIQTDSWVKEFSAISPLIRSTRTWVPHWVSDLLLPNREWNQARIIEFYHPNIAAAILNTPIYEGDDQLTWLQEKNGHYSVASGYQIAFQFYHPPSEFLPVCLKLNSRIPSVNPRCPRCQVEDETVTHCIFECPDSAEAWRISGLLFLSQDAEPWKRWMDFMNCSRRHRNFSEEKELAANLCWQLWKARNELLFEQRRKTPWVCLEEARWSVSDRGRQS